MIPLPLDAADDPFLQAVAGLRPDGHGDSNRIPPEILDQAKAKFPEARPAGLVVVAGRLVSSAQQLFDTSVRLSGCPRRLIRPGSHRDDVRFDSAVACAPALDPPAHPPPKAMTA